MGFVEKRLAILAGSRAASDILVCHVHARPHQLYQIVAGPVRKVKVLLENIGKGVAAGCICS
jgi:hypothetical protein